VQEQFILAVHDPDRVIREVEAAVLAESAGYTIDLANESAALDALNASLCEIQAAENRLYERWDAKQITRAIYDGQLARLETQRREAEQRKRQVLDRQYILERLSRGANVLREALKAAQDLPLEAFTPAEWTSLFDALVADVVLDAEGRSTLRWRQGSTESVGPRVA